ncbi:hypothetical protein ACKTEK_06640 [Tepidamorphus sp. 3E244]|uniref:hypothetical protein n=1 Tax=Tepidamorphus sp. 3E244 TaxID=3385498 RepID=UPI0038FC9843
MKSLKVITAFALLGASPAAASCDYQGYSYGVGSTVCAAGWYQECTVAGYWKAIGFCKAPDETPGASSADGTTDVHATDPNPLHSDAGEDGEPALESQN